MIHDLETAIGGSEPEFAWSLCLVGEDQSDKLATLTRDLRAKPSPTGDGKQITSGFSYWGIGPTMAWAHACTDPFYLVMKESIETFARRWRSVRSKLDKKPYHYVSLGVGTGHKDRLVLDFLHSINPDLIYLPVDMSSEMLRLGVKESVKTVKLPSSQIVPVQLDFSIEENQVALRQLLHRLVGEEPILFSLLGNTMANFGDDVELLRQLAGLLRPQDRFLLEVATTGTISDELAVHAAEEYSDSPAFLQFVTSALMYNTDLTINMSNVQIRGLVENEHSLLVKVVYENRSGGNVEMMLPDRSTVSFPDRDTIRLYLTRKYSRKQLDELLSKCGMAKVVGTHSDFPAKRSSTGFGTDLMFFSVGQPADQKQKPAKQTRAEQVWSRYPR